MSHTITPFDEDHFFSPSTSPTASGITSSEVVDDLLTVHEVARRLRVDDTTVRRWIANGVLEAVTLPHVGKRRSYRVKRDTMDTMLTPVQTTNAEE